MEAKAIMTKEEKKSGKGKGKLLSNPKLDLLIIDIDDTFIYHRTVLLANRIFFSLWMEMFRKNIDNARIYTTRKSIFLIAKESILNIFRFSPKKATIKKLWLLAKTAVKLHFINLSRKISNRFFRIKSCESMIRIWADSIVKLELNKKVYELSKDTVKRSIYRDITEKYKNIIANNPKIKVIAITEHFNVSRDPFYEVLGVNSIISNEFISGKQGIITSFRINVKDGNDKKRIAESLIKRYKAKSIGLIIEDYDDLGLLNVRGISLIIFKRKLKRFVPKSTRSISF